MPGLDCSCGNRIPYGDIPCQDEWLIISDADFDSFSGQVDTEELYRAMKSILRCPVCGHLWVFWNGYQDVAQEFIPQTAKPEKKVVPNEDQKIK
jgi:hypothetical protein